MKGLLAKDFALMKQRGMILLFLVGWGIVMSFVMNDSSYVVGWIVMIATITSVSTISYDEYDNCMPFLMSLPVTRRDYALEKYAFSLICGIAFWIIALIIVFVRGLFTEGFFSFPTDIFALLLIFALTLIVVAVSIPPQLKWGAEKGRLIMFILFGVIVVVAFLLSRFAAVEVVATAEKLNTLITPGVVFAFIGLCLALTGLSAWISVRIMKKKEF